MLVLNQICSFLKSNPVLLSASNRDGRINSSINEDEIIKHIQTKFKISVPKMRSWYDFAIETKNGFYPVNIKVTKTTGNDNLNCKLGIYYALTGTYPPFDNEINWLEYFELLKANMGKNITKDYYFLIVNKDDTGDVFYTSLKSLQGLIPNGNNLPFQCRWNVNRVRKVRTFEQSKVFILGAMGESIKLRASIYFNFKRLFPEYV